MPRCIKTSKNVPLPPSTFPFYASTLRFFVSIPPPLLTRAYIYTYIINDRSSENVNDSRGDEPARGNFLICQTYFGQPDEKIVKPIRLLWGAVLDKTSQTAHVPFL